MAPKTCIDCSMFSTTHGMDAHPVFTTEYEWLMHRHKSHGGPKPPDEDKPAEKGSKKAPAPAPAPAPIAVAKSEPITRDDLKSLIEALDRQLGTFSGHVEELQAQVAGQAAINEELRSRLSRLETPNQ